MKADSKSKALKDAEKCVELAPTWSKGYSRLGAAQQSLKRFDAAIDNFKKGPICLRYYSIVRQDRDDTHTPTELDLSSPVVYLIHE